MAVQETDRRAGPFTGDGSTTEFPFEFLIFNAADVAVFERETGGENVELTLGDDYEVELGEAGTAGGTVIFNEAPASGKRITIIGAQAYDQPLTLFNQGPYFAEDVMRALDRAVILTQQLREELDRAVRLPPDETEDFTGFNELLAELEGAVADAAASASAADTSQAQAFTAAQAAQAALDQLDGRITISEDLPEGGTEGDIWFMVMPSEE